MFSPFDVRSLLAIHVGSHLHVGEVEGIEESRRNGAHTGEKRATFVAGHVGLGDVDSSGVEVELTGALDGAFRLHIQSKRYAIQVSLCAAMRAESGKLPCAKKSREREKARPLGTKIAF
jgi:hypothetical protein